MQSLTKVVKSRAFKDRLKGHKDTIIALNSPYGHDGGVLFSASKDGQIRGIKSQDLFQVWDLVQRQITSKLLLSRWPNETTVYDQGQKEDEPNQIQQHVQEEGGKLIKDTLSSATFNEKNVYGGYEDGYISSWNMRSGETLYSYEGHEDAITSMHFLNMRVLISSSLDGTIRMWDTSSGACETLIQLGYPINYLRLLGETIQMLYNKNTIAILDTKTMALSQPIQFPIYSITSFLIHQEQLIMGTVDNNIYVYKMSDFDQAEGHPQQDIKPTFLIEGNQGWALCIEVLDKYVYVGTDEKKIRVYLQSNWTLVEEFIGHDDGITQITFADNMLYSGAFDHSIRSWDVREMQHRIRERAIMYREDLNSKRQEVYLKALPKKKKSKANKKKK